MSFFTAWFSNKEFIEKSPRPILSEILKTMRESAIVIGEDTRVLACNKAAYNAFGRKNGALEDKRLSEIIRDLTLNEAFRQALEEGVSADIGLEIPGIERRKYDVHISPLAFDKIKGAIGVFYDITKIERLERVRQEFLSNVSHELRTPLTSILAFVETLEDGAIADEENNHRFLSVIRKNAERMHHLIDDILELSFIESGKISLARKPIDLHALTDEVFTNISGKTKEYRIELKNEVPEGALIYADAIRFEQMLTNLIDNAVKFNVREGKVTVGLFRKNGKDIVSVADTGEGISSEHLQRIFERFYRTDRARSREIGGTGLGLAIVKHLARLHGGEVFVDSVTGSGSTFSIELPPQ